MFFVMNDMNSAQANRRGSWFRRNFDILIILAGIAIIPLARPFGEYYVSLYTSTASGADLLIYFAAFGIIILGLVLRIYRSRAGTV